MTTVDDGIVRDSLIRYFRSLAKVGHASDGDVRSLLVQLFADELLTGEFRWFINDGDYGTIRNLLSSISGTCLIPYTSFCADMMTVGRHTAIAPANFRISEAGELREDMEERPRLTEKDHKRGGLGDVRVTEGKELRSDEAADHIRFSEDGDL